MTPEQPINLEKWDALVDSNARSDPLLTLAARLREVYPQPEAPSPLFRERLRMYLIDQYSQQPLSEKISLRRSVILGTALLLVIMIAFISWKRLPGRIPSASAAEILELASLHPAGALAGDEVIYDRFILDWDQGGGWRKEGVVAELWRSPDGANMRFQMVDGEDLLYFDQHDLQTQWRSSYVRPLEGKAIKFVYQSAYQPPESYLGDKQILAKLLFRDLAYFWEHIDQFSTPGRAACPDPLCIVDMLGQGWDCHETVCTLNLGSVFEGQDMLIGAQTLRNERLANGREAFRVRLNLKGVNQDFYQLLKFDTATYALLEIEDYTQGELHYRIRLAERQLLPRSDLPPDFFQALPEGIAAYVWESDLPLGDKEQDHAWIITADPLPGASISREVEVRLEIGYRLTSIHEAEIVLLMGWVGHDTPYAIKDVKVPVKAGEGTLTVSFTLNSDELGNGSWALNPLFENTLDIDQDYGWNNPGTPSGINLEWCVRCQ